MANDTTGNPWKLDTTGVITTGLLRVRGVRWVGGTTAGHAATILDNNGDTLWTSVASGANYVESDLINSGPTGWNWQGLNLSALQSGTVYIEFL